MVPSLRTLHPLLRVSTLRWASRPKPKQAFQMDRYLLHDKKGKEGEFPYLEMMRKQGPSLEALLRGLGFPRKYTPTLWNIWWTITHTPQVLRAFVRVMQDDRPRVGTGVVVKSRIGRFFYDLVSNRELLTALNTAVRPWGFFHHSKGDSMQPTFSGDAITYSSYAYINTHDIRVGDVVVLLGPNYDDTKSNWIKRVAVLGPARIWVGKNAYGIQSIVRVEPRRYYFLGDNPSASTDSREVGTLPIETIRSKVGWEWGPDGFRWPHHGRRPWEANKSIEHLAPGQNRPTSSGPPIEKPEKGNKVILEPSWKPPLPPPSPKIKRKESRKSS